jgi:hypothetical protein
LLEPHLVFETRAENNNSMNAAVVYATFDGQGRPTEASIFSLLSNKVTTLNESVEWTGEGKATRPPAVDACNVNVLLLLRRILHDFKFVYCYDEKTCKKLSEALQRDIFTLQSMGVPAEEALGRGAHDECFVHWVHGKHADAKCTEVSAKRIGRWAAENLDSINLMEKKARVLTFANFGGEKRHAELLASFGFVCRKTGDHSGDILKCVGCNLCVQGAACEKHPRDLHNNNNILCPFVNSVKF